VRQDGAEGRQDGAEGKQDGAEGKQGDEAGRTGRRGRARRAEREKQDGAEVRCPTVPGQASVRMLIRKGRERIARPTETFHS
jgi:hypothetical protein